VTPLVAKVERARRTASLAQFGQITVAFPVWLRISFSKRSPQVWQMYS
jgi:hypothetical protein